MSAVPSIGQISRVARATVTAGPYATGVAIIARGRRGAFQKINEFARLVALVRQIRPSVVLEIGTAIGGTLWTWCRLATSDGLLVSVDLPGGPFGGGYDEQLIPVLEAYARGQQRLELVRADSHSHSTLEAVERILGGRAIDLLFIDGDHSYDGVKQDFEMYAPLARKLVVFHDILQHDDPECQVDRYWREIKEQYPHQEIVDTSHVDPRLGRYGGIGVLFLDRSLPPWFRFGLSRRQERTATSGATGPSRP